MGYDFGDLNDTVIDVFAEAATLTINGVASTIQAVFFAPRTEIHIGKAPVDRTDPRLVAKTSDIPAAAPRAGDTVAVGGREFEITSVMNDDGGMTELIMRETTAAAN